MQNFYVLSKIPKNISDIIPKNNKGIITVGALPYSSAQFHFLVSCCMEGSVPEEYDLTL